MTAIVGALPSTIRNGDTEDATVVMALFAFIQSQVNGNACPATAGSIVLKGDGAGGTTGAAPGVDYFVPVPGMVFDYAGGTVPNGYLLCDGSAVSRVTYASLFTNIGTTWGAGNGTTTFNVPDLRRRTTIGAGGVAVSGPANTLAAVGGEEAHVLTAAENGPHTHAAGLITINDPGHPTVINNPAHRHRLLVGDSSGGFKSPTDPAANGLAVSSGTSSSYIDTVAGVPASPLVEPTSTAITANNATTGITASGAASGSSGSGTAHNNMPPSAVVNKVIKT